MEIYQQNLKRKLLKIKSYLIRLLNISFVSLQYKPINKISYDI